MTESDTANTNRHLGLKVGAFSLAVAVLVAVAFIVGRNVQSPTQAAATAKAPPESVITAKVTERVLAQTTVFRGDVSSTAALAVTSPQLPSGSNPVVTSTEAHQGDSVGEGAVLASIAGRPIIVLQGVVPAFRTMKYGDSGIDVTQLQQALLRLGYGTGGDASGVFGAGTSRSVRWLYNKFGYQPTPGPDLPPPPTPPGGTPSAASPSWSVNLGEVVFVPQLPVVVASDSLAVGQTVTSPSAAPAGGAASSPTATSSPTVLTLGTGGVSVTGQIAQADAAALRPGMPAQLDDAITGGSWKGTVAKVVAAGAASEASGGVPQATITITPDPSPPVPQSEVGQNIRVTVTSARTSGRVLVVPISAVFSRPDGRSYVRVVTGSTDRTVPVSVGLDSSGNIEVTPLPGAKLSAGDSVVIGAGTRASG